MNISLPNHIKGIQVWAPSFCRSTLGFFGALAGILDLPLRVCLASSGNVARREIGYRESEFEKFDFKAVDDDVAAAAALDQYPHWLQIFGVYHNTPHIRTTAVRAISIGASVGIASEAPCNMEPPGFRRLAKAVYLSQVLPVRVSAIIRDAKFILNWSGDDALGLMKLGWQSEKIIPVGYFSPPLVGTTYRARNAASHTHFRILCTSSLTWHRGPDILIEALVLLNSWGVPFEAIFTGAGPLEEAMRARVRSAGIPVHFLGSVPINHLITLYENCSVFVAPGRQEPWGIRVNDALNAGAPAVVSRGMGSMKLINDYNIGVTFISGDFLDLAWKLRALAIDQSRYLSICENLKLNKDEISPMFAAARAALKISKLLDI